MKEKSAKQPGLLYRHWIESTYTPGMTSRETRKRQIAASGGIVHLQGLQ
jgi:hypothetical protein